MEQIITCDDCGINWVGYCEVCKSTIVVKLPTPNVLMKTIQPLPPKINVKLEKGKHGKYLNSDFSEPPSHVLSYIQYMKDAGTYDEFVNKKRGNYKSRKKTKWKLRFIEQSK